MNKIRLFCNAAEKARILNKGLSFRVFLESYQMFMELFCLRIDIEAVNSKKNTYYSNLVSLFKGFESHDVAQLEKKIFPEEKVSVLHSSVFSLSQSAIESCPEKFIVCDSFELWQLMQFMKNRHCEVNYIYSAIKALYYFYKSPSLITCFEFLRHSLFFKDQDHWVIFELKVRQQEIRYLSEILPHLPAIVVYILEHSHLPFKAICAYAFELLDTQIKTQLNSFQIIIDYIDQDQNLEWSNGLVLLASSDSAIKWGLNHALCYQPEQVSLALTQPTIPKFACSNIVDNIESIFFAKWNSWQKGKKLSIHACMQETNMKHPFIKEEVQIKKSLVIDTHSLIANANPDVSVRPKKISATALQQLMQNPYGFYAKYILGLKYLARIWSRTNSKDFGVLIHSIVEQSLKKNFLTKNIVNNNRIFPLWNKRIERIINWVQGQIEQLKIEELFVEKEILIDFFANQRPISLSARIDVLCKTSKGNLAINFKTGQPPLKQDVLSGYMPQLAIEMYLGGVFFKDFCQGEFWHLKGTQPVGSVINIPLSKDYIERQISRILHHYLLIQSPFFSCPWPLKKPKYDQYFYLERRQ